LQRDAYRIEHRTEFLAYRQSHKEQIAECNKRWLLEHPDQVKTKNERYRKNHKDIIDACVRRWRLSHPEAAQIMDKRHKYKRRLLGYIPLNKPFPGCNGHHVDTMRVIFIPEILHLSIPHNVWTGHNMDRINALAYEWLAKECVAC
jgi:hypothetical protein